MGNRAATAKRLTGDGVVSVAGTPALLWGATLTAAAADATLDLKNGTTSGAALWSLHVKAEEGSQSITFTKPVAFDQDIFADLTGAGAIASVAFEDMV
jgi:hypothetical protein